jgi:hypothetical protein
MRIMQLAMIFLMLGSCQSGSKKKVENLAPSAHQVTAIEVIQAKSYTYVRAVEDKKDYWIAIDKMDVKEGETYFWSDGIVVNNFKSKELNRTFPGIFFIQDFTDKPILSTTDASSATMPARPQPAEKPGITVPKAEGGVTIAELYAKKKSLEGKTIKIRGEVEKFLPQIMKRNWIHLQDGTRDGNNYDLTITTMDTVKIGDIVVFEGVLSVNKDFGAGYVYDVIVENARLIR